MLALLSLLACDPTSEPPSDAPTWSADVAPLVGERCASCHQAGGIGLFPLTTYDEAKLVASAMADAVQDRRMPPWGAAADCNSYEGDFSLTEAQIALIADWAAAGAPEGDTGADVRIAPPELLDDPDLTLQMPEVYTPPDEGGDDYRCFVVDWPYEDDVYVTAYDVQPGNTTVVHHLVAYIIEPQYAEDYLALDEAEAGVGYTCFGGPGGPTGQDTRWLGAWAPGGAVNVLPDGVGVPVSGGSKIVLQMHYNTAAAGAQPDQTAMLLRVSDTVDTPAEIVPWTNPRWLSSRGMDIPAGELGVTHEFSYRMPSEVTVYSSSLHMHRLGRAASLSVTRADDSEDCLLSIPDWDFNWQRTYRFTEPVQVAPGDGIRLSCTWDNTTDQDVYWGEGTGDEMCLATMLMAW